MSASLPQEVLRLCRRVLDDPDRGAEDIRRIGARGNPRRLASLLVSLLPDVPDPDLALIHLERYSRDCSVPEDPEELDTLLTLFGFSEYLAESLINDRGQLPRLVRARRQGTWGAEQFGNDLARLRGAFHAWDFWDLLRRFKRRANLRIGLKDLHRDANLADICQEISGASDAMLDAAQCEVIADLTKLFGKPQAYDESGRIIEATMAIIALGKLGGQELNYSSDVDLLFLYSRDGETTGVPGRPESQITNKEFFTRAAEALTRGLGQIGTEGQAFRVDCGLRPGGRDGDLVMPLDATLVYYGTWARPWERQALIKARPAAGDFALGERFVRGIERIIYTRGTDPAIIGDIRAMKDRVDARLTRRGQMYSHLKLGRGGIREIEFTVQALQMAHGGQPWIRSRNTLLALHRLSDKGFLSMTQYGLLSAAYLFLRETEHRLQIHRNLQRSVLPDDDRQLRVLARSLGYRDSAQRQEARSFLADLQRHQEAVRSVYDSVLGRLSQGSFEQPPSPDIFLDRMSDSAIVARLREAEVANPEALLGSIKAVAKFLSSSTTRTEVRRRFRGITPDLLRELTRVHNPLRSLRNLERFLASTSIEPTALGALLKRTELVPALVRLFAGSQLLTSTLLHRPGLVLDERFSSAVAKDRTVTEHLREIATGLAPRADEEACAAFLRVYQRKQILLMGLKDLNGQAGVAAVERSLSDLAEAIVRFSVDTCARASAWEPMTSRGPRGFVVLSLGKLGYRELDYTSDLDLMFLYGPGGSPAPERHALANAVARDILEMLTSITREGALYTVDTRLRPFGAEGELAQPTTGLREYFSTRAGIWEMQSFLKARPIAGDLEMGWGIVHQLEQAVLDRARSEDLADAVRQMKERLEREAGKTGQGRIDIKMGWGGLNAIQFAIQFLQLRHDVASPRHKRTTRLLSALRGAGLMDDQAYRTLFT
ncbi:MAG: bifunctional [glutamate--ammonia ligase]-adenylyl-L-tyrosine phosphorylase/[glutamate--ammonia-ligase] adenylyltransferase, partial [Acidobacteriota bacterium]